MLTSPDVGASGVSGAVAGAVEIPDFRPMLLPRADKPRRGARHKSMDNLLRKVRRNDAKPHVHAPRILLYRRRVLHEPLDEVLLFPYSLIQWMRSLEPVDGDFDSACDLETQRECVLNLAQLAVSRATRLTAAGAFDKYREASALYRAALDTLDASVVQMARRRLAA